MTRAQMIAALPVTHRARAEKLTTTQLASLVKSLGIDEPNVARVHAVMRPPNVGS